jgi:hypothetical protein
MKSILQSICCQATHSCHAHAGSILTTASSILQIFISANVVQLQLSVGGNDYRRVDFTLLYLPRQCSRV